MVAQEEMTDMALAASTNFIAELFFSRNVHFHSTHAQFHTIRTQFHTIRTQILSTRTQILSTDTHCHTSGTDLAFLVGHVT